MAELTPRRLPGVRFEPRSAPLAEALPRMDIAVFVGFAASGPLHIPVAVESAAEFHAIFGIDAALAWDADAGATVHALLAPTVRAFFANGGRRCWIVRVGNVDEATFNYFPVPNLLAARFDDDGNFVASAPTFARARSKGSYADALQVSSALQTRAVLALPYGGGNELVLADQVGETPSIGDTVRITDSEHRYQVFARVSAMQPVPGSPPPANAGTRLTLTHRLVLLPFALPSPVPAPTTIRAWIYTQQTRLPKDDELTFLDGSASDKATTLHPFATEVSADFDFTPSGRSVNGAADLTLMLGAMTSDVPVLGTFLRIEWQDERWWFLVSGVGVDVQASEGPGHKVRLHGNAWQLVPDVTVPSGMATTTVELISLDLRVMEGATAKSTADNLALAPAHPRYWNALWTDERFFGDAQPTFKPHGLEQKFEIDNAQRRSALQAMRFPLAGGETGDLMFVPYGMLSDFGTPVRAIHQSADSLTRDGLRNFRAEMFLDPALMDVGVEQLMSHADFIRYYSPTPRRLHGIHAVLGHGDSAILEEATLIAVPDAVHRNWFSLKAASLPPLDPIEPIRHPEWWHALPCEPPPSIPAVESPPLDQFLDADIRLIDRPIIKHDGDADATGTYALRWSNTETNAIFVLEEANFPDFSDARAIYTGDARTLTLYSRSAGDYYYRAQARVGRNSSHWSNPVSLRCGARPNALLEPLKAYNDDALISVQRALLRLCAGRGDLLALLSVPSHYREQDSIAHALRLQTLAEVKQTDQPVAPLGRNETIALSYAALYHPWLTTRFPDGQLGVTPPDGAVAGLLAARASTRGAWIAPANEPLRDIVALTPPILPETWPALQTAQVNVVRQAPRGFLCLSADTLSLDPDTRPINVRRLLILLRRLALRRGATYVFEPLGDSLRRLVRRNFEAVLFQLFQRGAFAGKTPETSYQVTTEGPPNTPQDADQGRFFVDLKVAPSVPMTFLSIRLLQAGDQLAVVEGG